MDGKKERLGLCVPVHVCAVHFIVSARCGLVDACTDEASDVYLLRRVDYKQHFLPRPRFDFCNGFLSLFTNTS